MFGHTLTQSKSILIIGFTIVLLLLSAITINSVNSIDESDRYTIKLSDSSKILQKTILLRDSYYNRHATLLQMAQSRILKERDERYEEYNTDTEDIALNMKRLQNSLTRGDDQAYLNAALKSTNKANELESHLIKLILTNKSNNAIKLLNTEIKPLHEDIVFQLALLYHSTKKNLDSNINIIVTKNTDATHMIKIMGLIALALGLLITCFVTYRIVKTEKSVVLEKERAEKASETKSMFLATMSHEIRSPLTAIIGFSQRLTKPGVVDEKNKLLVTSINRNSKHLLQLINDIMDITKIEAGQLNLEKVPTSPYRLLSEVESAIAVTAQDKGLHFKINYIFPLPEQITTDPTRFKQILLNLCSNAIKFTQKGSVSINVSCNSRSKEFIIDIIDTGIGLSEKQQEIIFDSFSQADSSTTRKYGGSGLGLNISRELARRLGGDIVVSSREGRGSKFSIIVSIDDINEASYVYEYNFESMDNNDDKIHQTNKLYGHVLLAEDTIDNQKLIELYVTETGAKITIVNNGFEAVKICKTNQFDLILMDMQMPVMDGTEATRQIRESGNTTPLIVLTANAMKSDYERCIDAGANDFLTKPIDLERFNQALYKFLPHSQPTPASKPASYNDKLNQLIAEFLDDLPAAIKRIKKLREEQNWHDLEQQTHILRGRGTSFGYPEITKLSGEINRYCHTSEHQHASEFVDKLDDYCVSILSK